MAKNPKQLGSEAVVVAEGSSSETQELVPAAPLSLYQKLALLRRELKHIDKKGTNSHFNYKYMRAEDVAGDLGDWLAEHNVIMARRNGKTTMSGDYVVFECDYIFVDAETLEEMSVYSMGVDKGDKAAYKAQTGALKYALTQATLMRVGDDPEDEREE